MDTTIIADVANSPAAADSAAAATKVWGLNGWDSVLAGDGLIISVVGIVVVFLSLTLLTLLIRGVARYVRFTTKKQKRDEQAETATQAAAQKTLNGFSGELVAAISLALNEYLYEQHDEEKTVITIQKISKPYSPWSSKLYNMTRPPHHSIKRG